MKSGYGRFMEYVGKVWNAHRFSWFLHNGPIPAGAYTQRGLAKELGEWYPTIHRIVKGKSYAEV